jgi:hypothetical protein
LLVLVITAAGLIGCGAAPAGPTPGPSAASPVADSGLRLACRGDTTILFAPAVLAATGSAESEQDPAAAALREFLASEAEAAMVPASGWLRVGQTATVALFLAPAEAGLEQPFHQVQLEFRNGKWNIGGVGGCQPVAVLRPGLGVATWWVDPEGPAIAPESRRFEALVLEQACANGQSSDGRIAPPLIEYRADAVVLTFGVTPFPGGADCPGHPPGHYTVVLTEPVGARALLDGGVFPPVDATQPRN